MKVWKCIVLLIIGGLTLLMVSCEPEDEDNDEDCGCLAQTQEKVII